MESGESSESVSTSASHHHHNSSLKHHQNGVGSGVLRSLTNVLELLKCSVCFDFMYSPIYQCHNGHTLCSSCKAKIFNQCPSCRQQLGDIRCLALEKMAESLELHCKYKKFGCPEIIPYYTKCIHEDSCNFQRYSCPWSGRGCSVVGDIPFLVSHLTDYHKVDMINGDEFKCPFLIADVCKEETCTWMVKVLNYFGQYFCLEAFFIRSAPVYVAFLRYMGNDADSCNYRYKLEIEGNGQKFSFEGIPRSIGESRRRIMENGDSLIVMRSMPQFLGGETRRRNLEVTGRIWKTQKTQKTQKAQISVCASCMDEIIKAFNSCKGF